MDFSFCRRFFPFVLLLLLAGGTTGCRKRKAAEVVVPVVVAPELNRNQLGGLPGPVYQSEAASPIHWQAWTKESLERAKAARRLIFVVIALPQQPGFREVLRHLGRDGAVVRTLNENYVPVLVDGNASRELGLLTAQLCAEIKQGLDLPVFLWMTYEGNPVAWLPVTDKSADGVLRMFNQSNEMVSRMWRDDASYVLKNSAMDNEARRERYLASGNGRDEEAGGDALQGARQLISLYDPFSRNMDEAGGLFPAGVLDVLTGGAMLPGVPEGLRAKNLATSRLLLEDLAPSAIFDPLEGGVFSARVSQSWMLPSFIWNSEDQSRIAVLLARAYQMTADPVLLERAAGLVEFSEKYFRTEEGLFALGSFGARGNDIWLWSVEDIEKALPAEDAKWWIEATGMKPLGNLPSETDPERRHFRENALALVRPLEETAARLGVPAADFKARFELSRVKLAAVRKARMKGVFLDRTPNAAASFRMVSAYAAMFTATGEESYREKARALLVLAQEKFYSGKRLWNYGAGGAPSLNEARAFVYGLAMQAAQDVADISSDAAPLAWIDELAGVAVELFRVNDFVRETSAEAALLDLPIPDNRKIFDDTSEGLFALESARLARFDSTAKEGLDGLAGGLPAGMASMPIIYTDRIWAVMLRNHAKVVLRGADLTPELKTAVERLPLQVVPRGAAKDSDGIPAGSVRVISADGSGKLISNAAELRRELSLPE